MICVSVLYQPNVVTVYPQTWKLQLVQNLPLICTSGEEQAVHFWYAARFIHFMVNSQMSVRRLSGLWIICVML